MARRCVRVGGPHVPGRCGDVTTSAGSDGHHVSTFPSVHATTLPSVSTGGLVVSTYLPSVSTGHGGLVVSTYLPSVSTGGLVISTYLPSVSTVMVV